jgi:hypothetical protein
VLLARVERFVTFLDSMGGAVSPAGGGSADVRSHPPATVTQTFEGSMFEQRARIRTALVLGRARLRVRGGLT